MLRSVLTLCAIMAVGWFGYWFWGANANKTAVENFLGSQENWTITYSQSTQRGFPNRYDVTLDDVLIASKDGAYSFLLPKLQIMRLSYRSTHWIIAFPQEFTLTGPIGKTTITATRFLGSAVTTSNATRIAFEADDLRIVSDSIFETPHAVISAVIDDQTATLGLRLFNKAGQELRARQNVALGLALPKFPFDIGLPVIADIYSSDATRLMQGELLDLGLPIRISGKSACEKTTDIWIIC